jgi:hypothetical protein
VYSALGIINDQVEENEVGKVCSKKKKKKKKKKKSTCMLLSRQTKLN